jgi:hypothetical protein
MRKLRLEIKDSKKLEKVILNHTNSLQYITIQILCVNFIGIREYGGFSPQHPLMVRVDPKALRKAHANLHDLFGRTGSHAEAAAEFVAKLNDIVNMPSSMLTVIDGAHRW